MPVVFKPCIIVQHMLCRDQASVVINGSASCGECRALGKERRTVAFDFFDGCIETVKGVGEAVAGYRDKLTSVIVYRQHVGTVGNDGNTVRYRELNRR